MYLAIDASGSPKKTDYRKLEHAILHHVGLRPRAQDRISYSRFGAGTWPPAIAPASENWSAALNHDHGPKPPQGFSRLTDFSKLFVNLREALRLERDANKARGIIEHLDLIIVISDGVPDEEGHIQPCPASFDTGVPFISPRIADSFIDLAEHPPSKGSKVMTYLVLAGGDPNCMPLIKAHWEARLGGAHGLRVIAVPTLKGKGRIEVESILDEIFKAAGRRPVISVRPQYDRLGDAQIELLAKDKAFEAMYLFWAFLRGGTVTLDGAHLLDKTGTEVARFRVENALGTTLAQSDHRAKIKVNEPSQNRVSGEPAPSPLRFYRAEGSIPSSTHLKDCRIQLITDADVSQESPLPVGMSADKKRSQDLLDRTLKVALYGCLPLAFRLLLYVGFALVPKGGKYAQLRKKYLGIMKKAAPYIDGLLIAVACVLTLSWMVIIHPVSFVLAPVVVVLMGVLGGLFGYFVGERKIVRRHHLWPEMVVVGIEFLVYLIAS